MIEQIFENLPAELQQEKRYIPLRKDATKRPLEGWSSPENWKSWQRVRGTARGFVIKDSDYLVFDGDHVLDDAGQYVSDEARAFFEHLERTAPTYAERSTSGHGLHFVYKVAPGHVPSMKAGRYYTYYFGGDVKDAERPKVEMFYGSAQQFVFTGNIHNNAPRTLAQGDKVNELMGGIVNKTIKQAAAQYAAEHPDKSKERDKDNAPTVETFSAENGPTEAERAAAMLEYVDAGALSYSDWVNVGMALKGCGCSLSTWDDWSAKDAARYHDGECAKKWRGFSESGGGVTIASLHEMARRGGYDEKAFQRAWREKNNLPELDFEDLGDDAEAGQATAPQQEKTVYNMDAFKQGAPVFLTDSVEYAKQIEAAGGIAAAVGTGALDAFIGKIKEKAAAGAKFPPIIGVMEPAAAEHLGRHMEQVKQAYVNGAEVLITLSEPLFIGGLAGEIEKAKAAAADAVEKLKELERAAYSADYAASNYLDALRAKIKEAAPFAKTGFKTLDKALGGGLFPGLAFVGAVSSLGKTTFCLQLADNIAAQGVDVLVFSLEMSRGELISKSLSRLTLNESERRGQGQELAKTTREIMTGAFYKRYSPEGLQVIDKAYEDYREYSDRLYFFEGVGDIGTDQIKETIERHIELTGNKPAVVVDYVQIIAPPDMRASDKQNVDKNVLELKRISRDFDIPIIGISSFNRNSYTDEVNMTAFKESGALEYGADLLIGLQYSFMKTRIVTKKHKDGTSYKAPESKDERAARIVRAVEQMNEQDEKGLPALIDLKILKHRNGGKRKPLQFAFWRKYNKFCESDFPVVNDSTETEENDFIIDDHKNDYDYEI